MQSKNNGKRSRRVHRSRIQDSSNRSIRSISENGTRGVYSVTTKRNYVEVLRFKLFHDYFAFEEDEHNFKKKVLKKYFNVSVVVDLVSGDTRK